MYCKIILTYNTIGGEQLRKYQEVSILENNKSYKIMDLLK